MVRPRRAGFWPAWLKPTETVSVIVSVLLIIAVTRSLSHPDAASPGLAFLALCIAAVGGWFWLFYRNCCLFATPETVGHVDLWGRMRKVSVARVSAVRLVSIIPSGRTGAQPAVLVVSKDAKAIFRVSGAAWGFTAAEIGALAHTAGLQVEGSWADLISADDLAKRFPMSRAPTA